MIPSGFVLSENIITEAEEFDLIQRIFITFEQSADRIEARPLGGRSRVLRFGHDYDEPHSLGPERPSWISELTLVRAALRPFNHHESVTINEYQEGGTIDSHVDSLAFEEQIGVLSLGGRAALKFDDLGGIFAVPARSLYIFSKEARETTHSLRCTTGPRWSIVFRKLITSSTRPRPIRE